MTRDFEPVRLSVAGASLRPPSFGRCAYWRDYVTARHVADHEARVLHLSRIPGRELPDVYVLTEEFFARNEPIGHQLWSVARGFGVLLFEATGNALHQLLHGHVTHTEAVQGNWPEPIYESHNGVRDLYSARQFAGLGRDLRRRFPGALHMARCVHDLRCARAEGTMRTRKRRPSEPPQGRGWIYNLVAECGCLRCRLIGAAARRVEVQRLRVAMRRYRAERARREALRRIRKARRLLGETRDTLQRSADLTSVREKWKELSQ